MNPKNQYGKKGKNIKTRKRKEIAKKEIEKKGRIERKYRGYVVFVQKKPKKMRFLDR